MISDSGEVGDSSLGTVEGPSEASLSWALDKESFGFCADCSWGIWEGCIDGSRLEVFSSSSLLWPAVRESFLAPMAIAEPVKIAAQASAITREIVSFFILGDSIN